MDRIRDTVMVRDTVRDRVRVVARDTVRDRVRVVARDTVREWHGLGPRSQPQSCHPLKRCG